MKATCPTFFRGPVRPCLSVRLHSCTEAPSVSTNSLLLLVGRVIVCRLVGDGLHSVVVFLLATDMEKVVLQLYNEDERRSAHIHMLRLTGQQTHMAISGDEKVLMEQSGGEWVVGGWSDG